MEITRETVRLALYILGPLVLASYAFGIYRMDDPKVVLLLFGSGKMVCVGAREVNNIKDAVRNIKEELSTAGLMRT